MCGCAVRVLWRVCTVWRVCLGMFGVWGTSQCARCAFLYVRVLIREYTCHVHVPEGLHACLSTLQVSLLGAVMLGCVQRGGRPQPSWLRWRSQSGLAQGRAGWLWQVHTWPAGGRRGGSCSPFDRWGSPGLPKQRTKVWRGQDWHSGSGTGCAMLILLCWPVSLAFGIFYAVEFSW